MAIDNDNNKTAMPTCSWEKSDQQQTDVMMNHSHTSLAEDSHNSAMQDVDRNQQETAEKQIQKPTAIFARQ